MQFAMIVALAAAAGCGRVGFGDASRTVDADSTTDAVTDAVTDASTDASPDASFDDALLYLAFEDSLTDGVLDDSTGNAFHARCVMGLNCPTPIAGVRGMGVRFNGTSQYALIPYQPALTTTALSVALWVYLETARDQVAIGKPVGAGQADSWAMVAWSVARSETCFETTLSGLENWACLPQVLPVATWFHLVGTWNGTTKRLYVNGVQVGSIAGNGLDQDTHDIVVGADQNGGAVVYHWHGRLDEVRVYNRALNQSEITALATP